MNKPTKFAYFFIGTEAELIKLFPVIIELKKAGVNTRIISSGQNNIQDSPLLKISKSKVHLLINSKSINKSPTSLIIWFLKTYFLSWKKLRQEFKGTNKKHTIMVVHGDTISTVMGSRIANKLGVRVAHVEAGLRSHDFLNPFPEELDRYITSFYTDLHFVPEKEALKNLKNAKGEIIDTLGNTILDSCAYSVRYKSTNKLVKSLINIKYFVLVMHRQENLLDKNFVVNVVKKIEEISAKTTCVLILHEFTKVTLENLGLLKSIQKNKNIITTDRLYYLDFMKLIENAQFIFTDGGSNQAEMYYFGKPTMLLRKKTEQADGIGENIFMYENNYENLLKFSENYQNYRKTRRKAKFSPSKIIADRILEELS